MRNRFLICLLSVLVIESGLAQNSMKPALHPKDFSFRNVEECEKAYVRTASMVSADISESEELVCYRCTLGIIPESECYSYKETGRYNNVDEAKKCMRK